MESLNPTRRSPSRHRRFLKQEVVASERADYGNMAQVLLDLSNAHVNQGQSSQALDLLYQALALAKEAKSLAMQAQIHDFLYRIHKGIGAASAALSHLEQRVNLQNQLSEAHHFEQMINGLAQELSQSRKQAEGYHAQLKCLEHTILERAQALESAQIETLERLATAGERHEAYSPGHTRRVGDLAGQLAANMGCDLHFTGQIRLAARLHDIGKIAISDRILQKPDKLTDEEIGTVQLHTLIGAEILAGSPSTLMQMAERIALSHHERWDGHGYPHHLNGEQIPLPARIVAVADAFDVMTHKRPYKSDWTEKQALDVIEGASGTHFDPQVVRALVRLFGQN